MAQMKTQSSRVVLAGVVLLLALMAVLADGAARYESITFDEMAHIGAGVSYLQKLDMRMSEEHPRWRRCWPRCQLWFEVFTPTTPTYPGRSAAVDCSSSISANGYS